MGARTTTALVAAGALTLGSLVVGAPSASADSTYPSAGQVARSKAAVASTAASVGRIEAQLAAETARSAALATDVAKAVEAYNGARYRLEQAVRGALTAQQNAQAAHAQVHSARADLGRFAAAAYRSGGDLTGLTAFLSASGPRDLLDRASTIEKIGETRRNALSDVRSADVEARILDKRAQEMVAARQDAANAVEAAKSAAEAKLAGQQQAVAAIAGQRQSLITALAKARNTSVRLERARQAGLEQARIARAAAAARAAPAAQARRAERLRQARAARAAHGSHRPPAGSGGSSGGSTSGGSSGGGSTSGGSTGGGSSVGSRSGAAAAIAFARAQIGKPYQWAADGPDSYDCSGLTMRAWQAGGVYLGHFTGAQYDQARKISMSAIRPGDLIFFGSQPGNPASIYHVGLYIGGGQMIEAPYTGENVRISSIWRDSLFGAARP
ncbi:MAG: peptidoglycan DL-endopeptidase CwlO [Actinomycetota bacterium]|nr:peptidoglycan DL-endopeptidase CwlO [Actinomycetota bacterium]